MNAIRDVLAKATLEELQAEVTRRLNRLPDLRVVEFVGLNNEHRTVLELKDRESGVEFVFDLPMPGGDFKTMIYQQALEEISEWLSSWCEKHLNKEADHNEGWG